MDKAIDSKSSRYNTDDAGDSAATRTPNPLTRRTNSWKRDYAIVYDVSSQTLTKEKRKKVGAQYTRIEIPPRPKKSLKDNVRLSVPVGPASSSEFLAEVKLSSLGYKVAFERFCGNIDEIWIKGVPNSVK